MDEDGGGVNGMQQRGGMDNRDGADDGSSVDGADDRGGVNGVVDDGSRVDGVNQRCGVHNCGAHYGHEGLLHDHWGGVVHRGGGVDGESHGGDHSSGGDGQEGGQNDLKKEKETKMISPFKREWTLVLTQET